MSTANRECQAWVANVGFPGTLEALNTMLANHEFKEDGKKGYRTDLESILRGTSNWTAPAWAMPGDIVFFYHTKRALPGCRLLLRGAEQALAKARTKRRRWDVEPYVLALRHAELRAKDLGGHIFAWTVVTGDAERSEVGGGEGAFFKGKVFASITRARAFKHPLPLREFITFAKPREGSITPLGPSEYGRLITLLGKKNTLPVKLERSRVGSTGFYSVTRQTWRAISCQPKTRFLNEAQLRTFWVDYLLREVVDPRTPIVVEAQCWRASKRTGIADYFVKLGGEWLPVETKLKHRLAVDLTGQLQKYTGVDRFSGRHLLGKKTHACCIPRGDRFVVVDHEGVHVRGGAVRKLRKVVSRVETGKLSRVTIRSRLLTSLGISSA